MATRKANAATSKENRANKFSVETFEALAEDMKTGRLPLKKVVVSDDVQSCLRAIVRDTGGISYHVQFEVIHPHTKDKERPYIKVGEHPGMSVKEARAISDTVVELGRKGINPFDNLQEQRLKELKDKGAAWRPK